MRDNNTFKIPAAVLTAFFAFHGVAHGEEDGLPGATAASSILDVAVSERTPDFTSTGITGSNSTSPIVPQLPAEIAPPASDEPTVGVADRLPFVLDDLMAHKERLQALGAGNWRGAREAVRSLYVARQFAPIWIDAQHLNAAGHSLLKQLRRAPEDGLSLAGLSLPKDDVSVTTAERAAEVEVSLSLAAVVYALEATGARLSPSLISPFLTPSFEIADPLQALVEVAVATDPGLRLHEFNPQHPGYQKLRKKLADLTAAKSGAVAEASIFDIARTQTDTRQPGRAKIGRFVAPIATVPASFDLVSAQQLRARIEANMEMWRWEPRNLGSKRIEVNIPEYTLRLYRGDVAEDTIRVIVGKPDTPTPVFSNAVKYLLVNPIWRVPESIVRKEMLPKAGGNPYYLEQHGFTVKRIGGQVFVEQPPGEGNALGHLLFMFPNEHSVYLHDTPSHGLFATVRRAYSHGCIRVEAPLRLASEVMGGDAQGWSEAKIERLFGSSERWMFLPATLPIYIEYFTASIDEDGALAQHDDVYGLTAKVVAGLSRLGSD